MAISCFQRSSGHAGRARPRHVLGPFRGFSQGLPALPGRNMTHAAAHTLLSAGRLPQPRKDSGGGAWHRPGWTRLQRGYGLRALVRPMGHSVRLLTGGYHV